MPGRRAIALIAALAIAPSLAACGGDDEQPDRGAPSATATADPVPTQTTAPAASRAEIAKALRSCQGQARSTTSLSDAGRTKVERICKGAEGGDIQAVKRATRAACVAVVDDTVPKAEQGRDEQLENCDLVLSAP